MLHCYTDCTFGRSRAFEMFPAPRISAFISHLPKLQGSVTHSSPPRHSHGVKERMFVVSACHFHPVEVLAVPHTPFQVAIWRCLLKGLTPRVVLSSEDWLLTVTIRLVSLCAEELEAGKKKKTLHNTAALGELCTELYWKKNRYIFFNLVRWFSYHPLII